MAIQQRPIPRSADAEVEAADLTEREALLRELRWVFD
jgi:hypothetical protein